MTPETIDRVNDLLGTLHDGVRFYDNAMESTDSGPLKALFADLKSERQLAILELSARVTASGGQPVTTGTTLGTLNELYAGILALVKNDDEAMVARLEAHEDTVLHQLQGLNAEIEDTPATEAKISDLLIRFRQTHDRMKALKDRLAA